MPLLTGTGRREDDIRRRAYEIYLARVAKGEAGAAKKDWIEAERRFHTEVRLAHTVEWWLEDPNL